MRKVTINKSWTTTFIRSVQAWNSGGGCMIDTVLLEDGKVLSLNEECLLVFENKAQHDRYFEHADDSDLPVAVYFDGRVTSRMPRDDERPFIEKFKKLCQPLNELSGVCPTDYAYHMVEVVNSAVDQTVNCAHVEEEMPYDILMTMTACLTTSLIKLSKKANEWEPGHDLILQSMRLLIEYMDQK